MCRIIKEIKTENNYNFSNFTNEQIEETAKRILEDFKIDTYPIPIVTIAEKIGFESFANDMKDDSISGVIAIDVDFKKTFNSDKIIIINKKDNPGHRKFTMAHELAHYIFDFNETIETTYYDAYITDKPYIDNPSERRANRFAAALLMPYKAFSDEYQDVKKDGSTIFEIVSHLAEKFAVSRTAVEKRIEELDLAK